MAEFPLHDAVRGKNVEIVWMPFELRPFPTPTLRPEGDYLQKAWENSVYPLARRLGVEIKLPTVSPQPYTRLAHEGLEFAKDHGKGDEYNSSVMRGFFQRSLDIGDIEVLADLAAEAGLERDRFHEALTHRRYAARCQQLLNQAYDMRVSGVPLFAVGNRILHGLQTQDALEAAIEQARAASG